MKRSTRMPLCLFFILSSYFFWRCPVYAQVLLQPYNCTALKASFTPANTDKTHSIKTYHFILEKELSPGLWQKIKVIESRKQEMLFSSLPQAVYRVSIVVPTISPNVKTVMYHHLLAEGTAEIPTTNTFLSNTAILGKTNCEETNKNAVSNSKTIAIDQIRIYPNPATDQLFIFCPELVQVTHLSLYTLTGELLHAMSLQSNSNAIDLSIFQPGIYFLTLSSANGKVATHRVSIIR